MHSMSSLCGSHESFLDGPPPILTALRVPVGVMVCERLLNQACILNLAGYSSCADTCSRSHRFPAVCSFFWFIRGSCLRKDPQLYCLWYVCSQASRRFSPMDWALAALSHGQLLQELICSTPGVGRVSGCTSSAPSFSLP